MSHAFGDAFSPYLIGAMADGFKPMIAPGNATQQLSHAATALMGYKDLSPEEYDVEFRALEYSLFSCCFFQVSHYTVASRLVLTPILCSRHSVHFSSLWCHFT